VWSLAQGQHGVVSRRQLLELGLDRDAIQRRLSSGRLHRVWRGVYAVGRPQLTRRGEWMAAVISCGPDAHLSHGAAAALWGIRAEGTRTEPGRIIDVTVPTRVTRRRTGIRRHRRGLPAVDLTSRDGIRVTSPIRTLMDLASYVQRARLEAAINDADKLGLVDPETLRSALDERAGSPGAALLRSTLDRRTFRLTDSELERRFLPLARTAGLPRPETGCRINGFKVDFHWPDLGLVVETDGLRYHRTPAQQATDRVRDQAQAAAGLTPLRFTHAQVRHEPRRVIRTLAAVARRLKSQ
jgi:very-short-patch-repair endonuclease